MTDSAQNLLELEKTSTWSTISLYIKNYGIYALLIVFFLNSLFLDLSLFLPKYSSESQNTSSPNINIPFITQNSCPQSCVDQMNTLMSVKQSSSSITPAAISITPSPTVVPTHSPTPTSVPASTPVPTSAPANTVKEFFVPLGTGFGSSGDWAVINGVGAKVDPLDYGNIKSVTFEATIRIPNGNQTVWIRLYNANTYQTVSGSDLSLASGTPTLLISSPISFASGNNLYQIQMKTQLQSQTFVDMARLRIKIN